jgi:DMSO/TMAO reductase YedYZ molybdopterin-dependent catalytic subunit
MKKALQIAAVLIICFACCTNKATEQLRSAEVKEYRGEKLGSATDFRENSIKGPQNISIDSYRLEVSGLVENPLVYTYSEALDRKTYKKAIQIDCVEGWSVKALWEGVLVRDLIDESKAKPEANTVIFYAYDGYTTSLPLQYIRDRDVLLAYKINNVTLPTQNGYPFQLAAEDKWGYKWIRWVTKIELSDNSAYRG